MKPGASRYSRTKLLHCFLQDGLEVKRQKRQVASYEQGPETGRLTTEQRTKNIQISQLNWSLSNIGQHSSLVLEY